MLNCQCEADLPEALRFGRVEVSCEGWDGPGDPYVLKGEDSLLPTFCRYSADHRGASLGSCGLSYRLVQVPNALRGSNESHSFPSRLYRWFGSMFIRSLTYPNNFLICVYYRPGLIGHHFHGCVGRSPALHSVRLPEVVFRRSEWSDVNKSSTPTRSRAWFWVVL